MKRLMIMLLLSALVFHIYAQKYHAILLNRVEGTWRGTLPNGKKWYVVRNAIGEGIMVDVTFESLNSDVISSGTILIPCNFISLKGFTFKNKLYFEGMVNSEINSKYDSDRLTKTYDSSGKVILTSPFGIDFYFNTENRQYLSVYTDDGRCGLIDQNLNYVIPFSANYSDINCSSYKGGKYIEVKKGDLTGLYNLETKRDNISTNDYSESNNSKSSGKSILLYSGTIYVSMQGYNQTTGQYVGSGPDAEFGVEIYNDYIIVGSIRYDYTRNTDDDSERVYEGTDYLRNQCYYYVNPKTFAMRMVKVYGNPYMGRNEYVSYQISNGPTTYQHNNPTYNPSGGNNNSGNSGGNSNTNRNNNNRQRRECSLCHGKRRIVRNNSVATFGNDSRVRCNECGGYFMRSTGHSHVTCTLCHGRGYLE